MQVCIINILNTKKGKVSIGIWVWKHPNHHPYTHLPVCLECLFTAGAVCTEAADWESIAGLAVAWRLTRTTDKDISANEDNSAAPSYLCVPVSLSNLAMKQQRQRIQDMNLSFIPMPTTQEVYWGFLSPLDVWDFMLFCQQWPFWRMIFLYPLSDFYWDQAVRQVAYKMSPFTRFS